MEIGLLILRLVLGGTILVHGAQKLFGWFGGYGIAGTGGWLESMGFRRGKIQALVSGLSEFGGGLLLATGFLTPLGAAAVVGVMIVAIAAVHGSNGFFNGSGGYEFNLLIIAAALTLAITGPGQWSLDQVLGLDMNGITWGLTALVAALLGSALALGTRHRSVAPQMTEAAEEEQAQAA